MSFEPADVDVHLEIQTLLMAAPPSPSNVQYPPEPVEIWEALNNGGFKIAPPSPSDIQSPPEVVKTSFTLNKDGFKRSTSTPSAFIRKKSKPKKAEFFVDHCTNTKCNLGYNHHGLCSFYILTGKRVSCKPGVYFEPTTDDEDKE
jgi:hypothetical protein